MERETDVRNTRPSSVRHWFCPVRGSVAQKFVNYYVCESNKLSLYSPDIRGGMVATYSCAGCGLDNIRVTVYITGCVMGPLKLCGAQRAWLNQWPGWERPQSLKPAVQNRLRCTFQKAHQALPCSRQRECLSTLPPGAPIVLPLVQVTGQKQSRMSL